MFIDETRDWAGGESGPSRIHATLHSTHAVCGARVREACTRVKHFYTTCALNSSACTALRPFCATTCREPITHAIFAPISSPGSRPLMNPQSTTMHRFAPTTGAAALPVSPEADAVPPAGVQPAADAPPAADLPPEDLRGGLVYAS